MTEPIRSCTNCIHYSYAKGIEIDLDLPATTDPTYPHGRARIRLSLHWCNQPDAPEDNFAPLAIGSRKDESAMNLLKIISASCSRFQVTP